MVFWRIALAAGGLLLIAPPAAAEIGLVLPPLMPPPIAGQAAECWLGHAQVQPSASRDEAGGEPDSEIRRYLMVDRHAGAEHPTAARMRPCNSLPPPGHPAGDEPKLRP
jgi:hypothetical protein